jgi:outer membrane lipoprotein SlyB
MRFMHRPMAFIASASIFLAACTTQSGRIGSDDGNDACRSQVVQLDSTGDYFGEDIIRGAAVGAAGGAFLGGLIAAARGGNTRNVLTGVGIGAVAGGVTGAAAGYITARRQQYNDQAQLNQVIAQDVSAENQQIDRSQRAFDLLLDCRMATAARIRSDYAARKISREQAHAGMQYVRAKLANDVAIAQRINERIGARGTQFDTAFTEVAPVARDQAGARIGRTMPVTTARVIPLRLRPDTAAPEFTEVQARERVTVRPAHSGYALVETEGGVRGYAPAAMFGGAAGAQSRQPSPNAQPATGDVRQLAATNIARRDNFAESVATANAAASGQGFELAS